MSLWNTAYNLWKVFGPQPKEDIYAAIAHSFSASMHAALGVDERATSYGIQRMGRIVCSACILDKCRSCLHEILDLNNNVIRCGCDHQ